ncbi:YcaO-like family protein [Paraliomyxa miuraensis]|uniref:YcaO-like family protein n=1 Tax=Paraliomyxa miuraensis TaxID=376150 RepID=UPI0022511269|nr:YcaO-like family protein [Paraliomyxa miuraensis]MCX4243977.1 YcaO-like family protein [Paraliomyxa miuraensis]
MTDPLVPAYTLGTHRLVPPEHTLARIEPLLRRCGITRLAEITGLDDDFGVPTYTAVRPGGLVLQTGNGKGLTKAAAKVSAAMEAIELFHAENPDRSRFVRTSLEDMRARGLTTLVPLRDQADQRFFHSDRCVIDWVQGRELITGTEPWLPASAAYFIEPTIYQTNTNGLASGNHMVEATVHALYELLERDAISQVVRRDMLDIRGTCRVVDPTTIADDRLAEIITKIHAANGQLVLLWVPARAPVHVLWAFLLDHRPHHACTALLMGAGAHPDLRVATARAITEAIQSRLTVVQAARDDIMTRPSFMREDLAPSAALRFFACLRPDTRWSELAPTAPGSHPERRDLHEHLAEALAALTAGGHDTVVRIDLCLPTIDVPVVKVIVPSLALRRELL